MVPSHHIPPRLGEMLNPHYDVPTLHLLLQALRSAQGHRQAVHAPPASDAEDSRAHDMRCLANQFEKGIEELLTSLVPGVPLTDLLQALDHPLDTTSDDKNKPPEPVARPAPQNDHQAAPRPARHDGAHSAPRPVRHDGAHSAPRPASHDKAEATAGAHAPSTRTDRVLAALPHRAATQTRKNTHPQTGEQHEPRKKVKFQLSQPDEALPPRPGHSYVSLQALPYSELVRLARVGRAIESALVHAYVFHLGPDLREVNGIINFLLSGDAHERVALMAEQPRTVHPLNKGGKISGLAAWLGAIHATALASGNLMLSQPAVIYMFRAYDCLMAHRDEIRKAKTGQNATRV